jgi:uncharacterized repeat protein (TIGR03803 family)
LYGTAVSGGTSDNGTVFAVNIDGTGFTTLHSFPETFGSSLAGNAGTNGDGASPWGGLILSSNTLYGTAHYGGNSFMGLTGGGTVFAIKTDGTGFEAIHSFSGGDGANPSAALIVSGTTLYGTTYGGTVFAVKTDGSGFTVLHEFAPPSYSGTNNDGFFPWAGLVLSGDTLFGTARNGGMSGNGTVFAVKRSGTTFTTLHSFSARTGSPPVNSDGAIPVAPLIASGNTLYGTASVGGSSGYGTIFAVNVDGTGFKVIHAFTGSDGAYPNAGLVLSGTTLYGTAVGSGSWGSGTVFAVNINGTGFMILHAFSAESTNASDGYTNSDGASPTGGLILSGNTLYGTTGKRWQGRQRHIVQSFHPTGAIDLPYWSESGPELANQLRRL